MHIIIFENIGHKYDSDGVGWGGGQVLREQTFSTK